MYSPVWQCLLGLSRGRWLWLLIACSLSLWRFDGLASQPSITDVLDTITLSPLTVILKSIFSTLPPNHSFQSSRSIRLHLAEGSPVPIGKTHKFPYLARAFLSSPKHSPSSSFTFFFPATFSTTQCTLPSHFFFFYLSTHNIFHQAKHLVDFFTSFRASSLYSCVEHQHISYVFVSCVCFSGVASFPSLWTRAWGGVRLDQILALLFAMWISLDSNL